MSTGESRTPDRSVPGGGEEFLFLFFKIGNPPPEGGDLGVDLGEPLDRRENLSVGTFSESRRLRSER
jgi:hypothetical protein